MGEWMTGDYVPLSVRQMRVVREIRPHEFEHGYLCQLRELEDEREFTVLLATLREIEDKGGLRTLYREDGLPESFALSSSVRHFETGLFFHLVKEAVKLLFRFASGAAGGLVVWLLTRAFPA